MRARIYPLALGKIVKHSLTSLNREVAGLLVGRQKDKFLEIWDTITGDQHGTPAYVHLDESVMAQVAQSLLEKQAGLYIVGWYHSHPGLDVFLSPTDIETQRRYQLMFPKAVALVIDPVEYGKTRRITSLKFKVFHIGREGRIATVPVSIGVNRGRLLESTIRALDTLDIRHIVDVDSIPSAKKLLSQMGENQEPQAGAYAENEGTTLGVPESDLKTLGSNILERAKRLLRPQRNKEVDFGV